MNHWALPAIAVMLITYGAVSGRLRSSPISQAMVFVTLGLLAGNQLVDLVDVDAANQFVRLLAEATLTLVLFTDAVRVNRGRLRHDSALPTRLLGVGLPLTIVAGTLAALVLPPAEPVDGRRVGHHAGPHRCRPGAAGGHQPAAPLPHPPGPQRRERPQ